MKSHNSNRAARKPPQKTLAEKKQAKRDKKNKREFSLRADTPAGGR